MSTIPYNDGLAIMLNGSPFEGLRLHKFTYESSVMSLGDKITGDVYYRNNALAVTMQEYVKYDGVKFVLVNPPTIVREGMVSDNSELKGMTKYSFTFYHPMYMLGNFPFTDVAVDAAESQYPSESKTFSWIGTLQDFVNKIDANLTTTEWKVILNATTQSEQEKATVMSDVLSFDKQYISDALKMAYDTWEIPFVISQIKQGEQYYSQGKRFLVSFGLPTDEILDDNDQPYVFRFGQGVGLKNNSRTPRNNKIVTRIVGYGAERNVPYGYPQIPWTGNQSWNYTINNASGMQTITVGGQTIQAMSYPIYDGIVGGQKVRLIKHPFTRNTLQPSIYADTVNRKVNPNATDYDPNVVIVDYYDAIDDATYHYPNNINALAPSVDIHQFEKIYPRLNNAKIVAVQPYDDKIKFEDKEYTPITLSAFNTLVLHDADAAKNKNEEAALHRLHLAINGSGTEYAEGGNGGSYTFETYAIKVNDVWYMYYVSDNVNYEYAIAQTLPQPTWDDSIDDDGKYKQSYFKITLPQLSFDLYACAAIKETVQINMRSGACLGCNFTVQIDWDDYKLNFYDESGKFDPVIGTGHRRDGSKYPDSSQGQITVIVAKDTETFGTLMPNTYQMPKGETTTGANDGDQFVVLGISLPQSYITTAQAELDDAMKEYMLENNVYYFDYPLKFDEYFLTTNDTILAQIHNNVKVHFMYSDVLNVLYVKQIAVKYGENILPQYDITLTDDVEIVLNSIGQVTDSVGRMRIQMNELQKYCSENLITQINDKLSRIVDDVCQGLITFQQGLNAIGAIIFSDDARSDTFQSGLDGRGWRVDHLGNAEFESCRVRSYLEVIELLVNRMQAQEGDTLFTDNDQIDRVDVVVDENTNTTSYILSLKEKYEGYITAQQEGNIIKGIINTLAAKQADVSDEESTSVETDGENKYYTSWMRIVETHNTTGSTLSVNQIRVVLYGDSDVPANKNFAPCELMVIARWGCALNPNEQGISEGEKQSRIRRQRLFAISVADGRVVKYTGVNTPKLQSYNYGVAIGELPDFVKQYASVASVLAVVGEHTDWLYAQGIVVGHFIKVDVNGVPEVTYVDCGEWVNGGTSANPTPRNGIYLCNEYNETSLQYETHDVWHNNAKWRCLQHQPVTSGGVTRYYEPTDANSAYWQKLEGANVEATTIADLDNEMDSIACDNQGYPSAAQTVRTVAKIYQGSTSVPSTIAVLDTNSSGYAYDNGVAHDGITVSWYDNTGEIVVIFATSNIQPTKKTFYILLHSGTIYRSAYFTVNCLRGVPLYRLVPSVDKIVKRQDGTYVPSANITCAVSKMVNGTTSTPAASEYTLEMSVNGGAFTTYAAVAPSTVTSNIIYRLTVGGDVVDKETVPLVIDGKNGKSVIAQYSVDGSTNWHSTYASADKYMRTSEDGGTTWGGAIQIVGEKGGQTDYQFGISKEKTTGGVTEPPSDISTWSDAPVAVTTAKPYLWSKVQEKDGSGNNVGDATYIRLTGEASVTYEIRTNKDSFTIPAGATQVTESMAGFTYKKIGDATPTYYAAYITIYWRTGTTYTYLTSYSNYSFSRNFTPTTSYDAIVIFLFASAYTGDAPTSQSYLAKKEVLISKDGDNGTNGHDGYDGDDGKYYFDDFGQARGNTLSGGVPSGLNTNYGTDGWSTDAPQPTTTYPYIWMRTRLYDPNTYTFGAAQYICLTGKSGQRGKVGRFFYYGGVFNSSNTTDTFPVNDAQTPYFKKSESEDAYYVFNPETPSYSNYTMYQMWQESGSGTWSSGSWNNAPWEVMTNDFKYLITEAIFGNYAHFGSGIINGDWMISTNGTLNGSSSNNYTMFNPLFPSTSKTLAAIKLTSTTVTGTSIKQVSETFSLNSYNTYTFRIYGKISSSSYENYVYLLYGDGNNAGVNRLELCSFTSTSYAYKYATVALPTTATDCRLAGYRTNGTLYISSVRVECSKTLPLTNSIISSTSYQDVTNRLVLPIGRQVTITVNIQNITGGTVYAKINGTTVSSSRSSAGDITLNYTRASGTGSSFTVQCYISSSSYKATIGSVTIKNGGYSSPYIFEPHYAVDLLTGETYQNNAIVRGTIYADSGTFKGLVATPYTRITSSNFSQYFAAYNGYYKRLIMTSASNFQIEYLPNGQNSIALPVVTSDMVGAELNIMDMITESTDGVPSFMLENGTENNSRLLKRDYHSQSQPAFYSLSSGTVVMRFGEIVTLKAIQLPSGYSSYGTYGWYVVRHYYDYYAQSRPTNSI